MTLQLDLEPGLDEAPLSLDRPQRDAERACGLLGGEPGEIPQVHDASLARVLHQEADILLLDEPTRGIDVGTKSQIYRLIGKAAADGKAVLFVSSYLPELLAVCDRIGVMARGSLQEVRDARDWTEEDIMSQAIGGEAKA